MTRINLLCVTELHQKHLVAEYRELPRVFNLVRRAQSRGLTPADIRAPAAYTMGAGHVLFFYDKLGFLVLRQGELIEEMRRRDYRPSHVDLPGLVVGIDAHWLNDWTPDEAAVAVSRARIAEKLAAMGVS